MGTEERVIAEPSQTSVAIPELRYPGEQLASHVALEVEQFVFRHFPGDSVADAVDGRSRAESATRLGSDKMKNVITFAVVSLVV